MRAHPRFRRYSGQRARDRYDFRQILHRAVLSCIGQRRPITMTRRRLGRRRAKGSISAIVGPHPGDVPAMCRRRAGNVPGPGSAGDRQLFLAFADFCCSRRAGLCMRERFVGL